MQIITGVTSAPISGRARKKWAIALLEKARAAESQGNELVIVELRKDQPFLMHDMESLTGEGTFEDPFI
jgi:hypothetical protein